MQHFYFGIPGCFNNGSETVLAIPFYRRKKLGNRHRISCLQMMVVHSFPVLENSQPDIKQKETRIYRDTHRHRHICSHSGRERMEASKMPEQSLLPAFCVPGTRSHRIASLIIFHRAEQQQEFYRTELLLLRNYWFRVIFLSLWPLKGLNFWCLICCATFMIMIKNIPVSLCGVV